MSLRKILGLGLLGMMLAAPLMYSAPQGRKGGKAGAGKGGRKKGGGKRAPTKGGSNGE